MKRKKKSVLRRGRFANRAGLEAYHTDNLDRDMVRNYGIAYTRDPEAFTDALFMLEHGSADAPLATTCSEGPVLEYDVHKVSETLEYLGRKLVHALKVGKLSYIEGLLAARRSGQLKLAAGQIAATGAVKSADPRLDALFEYGIKQSRGMAPSKPALFEIRNWVSLNRPDVDLPIDDSDLGKLCNIAGIFRAGSGKPAKSKKSSRTRR